MWRLIVNKLMSLLEKYLSPIAERIEQQRHVQSIKNGMMALISILMVGSFTLVLNSLFQLTPEGTLFNNISVAYGDYLNLPFTFTFGFLALYAAITISFAHAKEMKVPITHGVIGGVLTTLTLNVKVVDGISDVQYLDSRGMFIAIIASLVTIEVMSLFMRKKWTLRFNGLPEMIANTFEAIIPLMVVIVGAIAINVVVMETSGGEILPELLTTFLSPAVDSVDSVWAVMLISFLEMLFWFVGLNGYAILIGFVMPFLTANLAANAAAYQAGLAIPNVFVPTFWDYFMGATGSGLTGALVFLAARSKVHSIRAVGRASIVPAIFTISEPMVFGLPIAYNPYLFIPFVFGTPLVAGFTYEVMKFGFVRPPVIQVGGIPVPLAQYLTTMDPMAVVLFFVIMIIAVAMYYPFFKVYEKHVIDKEALEMDHGRETKYDELELDF